MVNKGPYCQIFDRFILKQAMLILYKHFKTKFWHVAIDFMDYVIKTYLPKADTTLENFWYDRFRDFLAMAVWLKVLTSFSEVLKQNPFYNRIFFHFAKTSLKTLAKSFPGTLIGVLKLIKIYK